jgi:hypothetical protein
MTAAETPCSPTATRTSSPKSRRHLHDQVADATRTTVDNATGRIVIATRSHIDFHRKTAIIAFILGRQA